ncbi:MAG TPA: SDR family oxidoreductase [Anaerolineaceae bacterium]
MTDMLGKTCLVTGATDGIGKKTAEALAAQGARVVIVGRNPEKTTRVVEEMRTQSRNEQVEGLVADLSVQAEVRRLAGEVLARCERLDVLVNNAGGVFMRRELSQDGIEMTFALNHLNYFLLTNLLLERLKASAPARVVVVSSGAHLAAKLDFNDLQGERSYQGWVAYSRSKLANLYFAYELARRLAGTGVTVNALHPGFVATRFGLNNQKWGKLFRFSQLLALRPEQGAETSIYLASSPDVEGVTGKYFDRKRAVKSSAASYDETAARRLWEISLALTGLDQEAEITRLRPASLAQ